jgi:hypothetical protein
MVQNRTALSLLSRPRSRDRRQPDSSSHKAAGGQRSQGVLADRSRYSEATLLIFERGTVIAITSPPVGAVRITLLCARLGLTADDTAWVCRRLEANELTTFMARLPVQLFS